MGYTHYYKQKKEVSNKQWIDFEVDVYKLLKKINKEIKLESNDGDKNLVASKRINFNGVGEDAHETFYLQQDGNGFGFCKTNNKPYDLAVCAVLLLMNKHMPESYEIGSDGDFNDWKEAMTLNAKVFGNGYLLPVEIQKDAKKEVTEFYKTIKKKKSNTDLNDKDKSDSSLSMVEDLNNEIKKSMKRKK